MTEEQENVMEQLDTNWTLGLYSLFSTSSLRNTTSFTLNQCSFQMKREWLRREEVELYTCMFRYIYFYRDGATKTMLSFIDWLDDIGLPQYKDSFRDNLVDGRMLNYLTVVCGSIVLSL